MNKFLSILLILCLPALLSAQGKKIKFVEYDMPNGLHVILHQDPSTPIVAVSVMYHVGSKNEDTARTGFAHFFEHLLFEGSENIKRGEFDKYIEGAGGANNANTNFDRTFYYELLPSNQLELGLWLESERMMHAKVEQIGIETQRQVVKEERRMRIDNRPYGTLLEQTMRRLYKEHPYRWPVIGSMQHLDNAKEADYKNFYKTFYVPNNAILSIAGDISIEQSKKMVEKYFSGIPKGNGAIPRPSIVEPPLGKEVRDIVYDNIQLPAVVIAYRAPKQGTADFYALEMLGKILSDGESSRLNKEVKDNQQKAIAVGNFPLGLEDPGAVVTYGICMMGVKPEDLEKSIDEQVEILKTTLISDDELSKLKNQVEKDMVMQLTSVAGIAESLANYKMYFGDANLINTEIERYMKVTKEDIQRVAKKYLEKNNRVVLYYLPKK